MPTIFPDFGQRLNRSLSFFIENHLISIQAIYLTIILFLVQQILNNITESITVIIGS